MPDSNQTLNLGNGRMAHIEWPSDITLTEVETMFSALDAFRPFLEHQTLAEDRTSPESEAPTRAIPPPQTARRHNTMEGEPGTPAELREAIVANIRSQFAESSFRTSAFLSLCSDKVRLKNSIQHLLRNGDIESVGRGEYRLATCPKTSDET